MKKVSVKNDVLHHVIYALPDKKRCSCCHKYKPLSKFYKSTFTKDGLYHSCKRCHLKRTRSWDKAHLDKRRSYRLKYWKKYRVRYIQANKKLKKANPWWNILSNIKKRCYDESCKAYKNYGARGIKNFLSQMDIKLLYKRDHANLMKQPSIDRINNDGNYELSNCRFIEKSENSKKQWRERRAKQTN